MDIEVAENSKGRFTGIISRDVKASEVFEMLQKTGSLKVNTAGNKIRIYQ